jgi:hypothetical protein
MIDSLVARLGTRIQEDASFRLELFPNSIKEPSVGVDLLRILLLEHKDDLDRDLLVSSATERESAS